MKDAAHRPGDVVPAPPARELLEDRRQHRDATNLPALGRPIEGVANENLPLVEVDILPAEAPDFSGSHPCIDGDRKRRALLGGEIGKIEHRANLVDGEMGPILIGSCLAWDAHTFARVSAGPTGRDCVGESRREGIERVPHGLLSEWLAFARPVGRALRDKLS
ncbi:MAG: hypothetical protein WBN01_13415 [Polyangiales bacterium]